MTFQEEQWGMGSTVCKTTGSCRVMMVCLISAGALLGCASSRTIRSVTDFDALPASKGVYGGSFFVQRWSYLGSDASYEHFNYSYTRDNFVNHIHVRVVRGMVTLGFEGRPYRLPDDGLPVIANYRNGWIAGFDMDTNDFSFLRRPVRMESRKREEK